MHHNVELETTIGIDPQHTWYEVRSKDAFAISYRHKSTPNVLHLDDVYVPPEKRNQGLGSLLVLSSISLVRTYDSALSIDRLTMGIVNPRVMTIINRLFEERVCYYPEYKDIATDTVPLQPSEALELLRSRLELFGHYDTTGQEPPIGFEAGIYASVDIQNYNVTPE